MPSKKQPPSPAVRETVLRAKCLLLVPRGEGTPDIFTAVRIALERAAVSVISFEDRLQVGALWVDGVMASLREADFVVADLTGRNPNILFELGVAHGLGKPFVLLVSTEGNADIPTDLMGYQYIAYRPGNIRELIERVERFSRHVVERLSRT